MRKKTHKTLRWDFATACGWDNAAVMGESGLKLLLESWIKGKVQGSGGFSTTHSCHSPHSASKRLSAWVKSHHQNAHRAGSCESWEPAPIKHKTRRCRGKWDDYRPQIALKCIVASLVTLLICEIETNFPQLSSSADGTGTNLITASRRSDLVHHLLRLLRKKWK